MSSLVRRSHRGQGGHKLEINIPQQQIHANSKGGGLINEGGTMSSECGSFILMCYTLTFTAGRSLPYADIV